MVEKSEILIEKEKSICTITIDRPEKRNALNPGCLSEIAEAFNRLGEYDTIKVVVLRGAGRQAFSAGADISTMPTRASDPSASPAYNHSGIAAALTAIQNYPGPVIAMLHGYTLGAGMALAMACDIRVASESVKMGIPTSRMGLIPTYEDFKRFLMVLGYGTSLEIFLTGRQYRSQECLSMGMINHLVADDELEQYTYALAEEITRCAPLSLRGAKYILTRMAENANPSPEDLSIFKALWDQARNSDDHEEAKMAFREKRRPVFAGR